MGRDLVAMGVACFALLGEWAVWSQGTYRSLLE